MSENADAKKWVIDTSDENFAQDVLERSKELGIVVDFWAPWCGPCRMLAPVLEQLAAEYDGRFLLVQANVDEMPKTAAEFGVSSIPVVYGFREGQMAEQFMGVLPEADLRQMAGPVAPESHGLKGQPGRGSCRQRSGRR